MIPQEKERSTSSLAKYLSKLSPKLEALWQRPLESFQETMQTCNTPVTPDWRPYCVLTATQVAERSKDARGRSEDAENCPGREPTAITLNMFKVVAGDAIVVVAMDVVSLRIDRQDNLRQNVY
ncbi:hypothetical protein DPMN_016373 [Dreissena polymorpha]|uniref:Uncharacterized protein n=1 Tax=Dreissena polymorpha TaxID=45954 RepID=A0A9D4S6H7_DREPO|nr:hypothetical protein DPMN_016373 [Dreissena polymorpha]